MSASVTTAPVTERSRWRAVALPTEHGGWGLTLEPVLLGLLIAWSVAGLALGIAALLAFLVRTPLKLALIDLRRDRWLARSAFAVKVATAELLLMAGLAVVVVTRAGWGWVVPVVAAAPLVAVQLWFDVRSRGRRLVPEVSGAVGMASTAAAILVAGGKDHSLAIAVWLVLAARSIGAMPFVRVQIMRLRRGTSTRWHSDLAQLAAVAVGSGAAIVDHRLVLGAVGVGLLAVLQLVWVRRPPTVAKVLGLRQMALGFGLVALAAVGVIAV